MLRDKRYIWENTGPNHWASALWFYYIARKRGERRAEILGDLKVNREMIEVNEEGQQVMRSLEEVFEEMKY